MHDLLLSVKRLSQAGHSLMPRLGRGKNLCSDIVVNLSELAFQGPSSLPVKVISTTAL